MSLILLFPALENIVKAAIKFIDKKKPNNSPDPDTQSSLHELTAALALGQDITADRCPAGKNRYVRRPAFLKADQRNHDPCR